MSTFQALSQLRTFAGTPPAILRSAAELWSSRELSAGEVLWDEGSACNRLAILVDGQLEAVHAGRTVGSIEAGQMVGEVSIFTTQEDRSAAVRAAVDSRALVISVVDVERLAEYNVAVYNALLDHALTQSVQRINAAGLAIARRSLATFPAPKRKEESAIKRLLLAIARPEPHTRPPPVVSLLRSLDGLKQASTPVVGGAGERPDAPPLQGG